MKSELIGLAEKGLLIFFQTETQKAETETKLASGNSKCNFSIREMRKGNRPLQYIRKQHKIAVTICPKDAKQKQMQILFEAFVEVPETILPMLLPKMVFRLRSDPRRNCNSFITRAICKL